VNAEIVMSDQSTAAFARKRILQGLRGLSPGRAGAHVDRSVLSYLTPAQRARFEQMPAFDQQHLCRVANYRVASGVTDSDVIVAGLLHDIGKSDGNHCVTLPDRIGKVLMKRFAPGALHAVAADYPNGRFTGLALTVRHPEIGAEVARELGCSERTCWLIRFHESESDLDDPDLALLQAADFAS
jgi:hypothetical protein